MILPRFAIDARSSSGRRQASAFSRDDYLLRRGIPMSHSKTLPSSVDRRRFLHHAWSGVAASLSLALLPGAGLFASRRFGDNPFTLGVASGDPTANGIVLWTRLAPEPANPAAMGQSAVPVGWRVARDSGMRNV